MINVLIYVFLIVLVNYGFSVVPLMPVLGEMFPPMSLAVGLVFVARDFAQRAIGHRVWSYLMADPFVAVASVVAFAISEAADWGVYSYTKKPFAQRILISSVVSTPLDSAVFLLMIGHFSWLGCLLMTAAKLIGAVVVCRMVSQRDVS
jgi:queuosine precursor transporter